MIIGEKIKRLRTQMYLTQEELANRCELTKGYISQIENDLTSPSIATLVDILECLGTDLNHFFSEEEEVKIVFNKEDTFLKEEDNYTIKWLIPNAQKNDMEPIYVEIESQSSTKVDSPHEGEEFGYIISGNLILHYGKKKFKVKKGESFYFKANKEHYLENKSKYGVSLIWVSSPPYF